MSSRMRHGRRLGVAALALTLVLGVGGCSYLRAVTGIGFKRPTLTYESWSPEQLDTEGVTIALRYRVDNPNDFSVDLRELAYRLEVEGQQVVEGQIPERIELQANSPTAVSLPVRVRWRDIPNFMELVLTRSDLRYRVTGNAGIGSALGTVLLPFEHQDRLVLPRLQFRLGGDAQGR